MRILKELRKSKGITQGELSNVLGISRSAIAMWETGASEPDKGMLISIASYFGVSIDYLLEHKTPATYDNRKPALSDVQKKREYVLKIVEEAPDEKLDSVVAILRSVIDAVK